MKYNVPSKSERDDGGDQPIGILGLIFGAIIFGVMIYTLVTTAL